MMIDAKQFMEFFEKQYGVEFVDAKTGKRTLDVISEHDAKKDNLFNSPSYKPNCDKLLKESDEANQ